MSRSDVHDLEAILDHRKAVEEEATRKLTQAVEAFRLAVEQEKASQNRVRQCEVDVARCDGEGGRDLDVGVDVAGLAARAAFRTRLSDELDEERRAFEDSREACAKADESLRLAQKNLANAAARRLAVENALSNARRSAQSRADDLLEEEVADHIASRRTGEEESSC